MAPVPHPAFVVANSLRAHVAKVLSLPVARGVANSRTTIPNAHLLNAVVSKPAGVAIVGSTVAPDLSRSIALLDDRLIVAHNLLVGAGGCSLATPHWKLPVKWDPRSRLPGKSKRGQEQKREHLPKAEFNF